MPPRLPPCSATPTPGPPVGPLPSARTRCGTRRPRECAPPAIASRASPTCWGTKAWTPRRPMSDSTSRPCGRWPCPGRVDLTVIALWLGHESPETTHQYVEADLKMKEEVLTKAKGLSPGPSLYRPKGKLLEFLDNL